MTDEPRSTRSKASQDHHLTHLDERGRARMVDVGGKPETAREAVARCRVRMTRATADRLLAGDLVKGDALAVARVAGILAAKRTPELIPLCHPLNLASVAVDFRRFGGDRLRADGTAPTSRTEPTDRTEPTSRAAPDRDGLEIEARVSLVGGTGAEMEALTACAVAALTIYDMAKAVDRGMTIDDLRLVRKSGGRSGVWERPGETGGPAKGTGD
ncbi:MAG: cyclic pyranopterin monophosphate synthase MoaC [Bacillota bacterium]